MIRIRQGPIETGSSCVARHETRLICQVEQTVLLDTFFFLSLACFDECDTVCLFVYSVFRCCVTEKARSDVTSSANNDKSLQYNADNNNNKQQSGNTNNNNKQNYCNFE